MRRKFNMQEVLFLDIYLIKKKLSRKVACNIRF